ncbi:cation:proton antiporter [Nostoc sp. CHAB 5714]|uniref:Cation:proton antiporter n=1 Tax=Nostoc favosum CHAB5714 TaxID=2780399 RepID=A0ABS8II34_9NOSO|nr:cation:proton antiporter [Nostoc favosum]MCC5603925.1 cation:proton antiporter [Nostoc favosum CHAB5714]
MDVTQLVKVSIILLLLATVVALLSRRLRIPYVTGLVLAGLPITELLSRPIGLNPTLVLNLFLPILIFEAGINTDVSRLRSTFKPIALLAGPGAVLSSGIIAVLLKSGVLPKAVYEEMRSAYQVRIAGAEKTLRELYNRRPDEVEGRSGSSSKLDAIRRRLLLAEKGALNEAMRKRILSEEIVRGRIQNLDEQLLKLEDD